VRLSVSSILFISTCSSSPRFRHYHPLSFQATRSGTSQANHEHDDLGEDSGENSGKEKIRLKNDLGTLVKRKIPQVLRDYYVSKDRNSEKYYHRLLLL
jgi:hypothetical protein